jgi:hypothetical protein
MKNSKVSCEFPPSGLILVFTVPNVSFLVPNPNLNVSFYKLKK